jgi:hypothetical protein
MTGSSAPRRIGATRRAARRRWVIRHLRGIHGLHAIAKSREDHQFEKRPAPACACFEEEGVRVAELADEDRKAILSPEE